MPLLGGQQTTWGLEYLCPPQTLSWPQSEVLWVWRQLVRKFQW